MFVFKVSASQRTAAESEVFARFIGSLARRLDTISRLRSNAPARRKLKEYAETLRDAEAYAEAMRVSFSEEGQTQGQQDLSQSENTGFDAVAFIDETAPGRLGSLRRRDVELIMDAAPNSDEELDALFEAMVEHQPGAEGTIADIFAEYTGRDPRRQAPEDYPGEEEEGQVFEDALGEFDIDL